MQLPRVQKLWVEIDEDNPSNDAKLVQAADMAPPNPEPRKKKKENIKQKTENRNPNPRPESRAPSPKPPNSKL